MLQIALGVAAAAALLVYAPGASRASVEQPRYEVLERDGRVELRAYPSLIAAETVVQGDESTARNRGFRRIADYIFGANQSRASVAMTAPVAQAPASGASEKIAMTAPVAQEPAEGGWRVQFFMPAAYDMDTLPRPNSADVVLRRIPAERYAVIRFSGLAGRARLAQREAELRAAIAARGWEAKGPAVYWFYDPPWTPPPMRRNEVALLVAAS
ncbi:MAG: heme-binding protein [Phenylobacterium sp.]|uniref:SOUL family heme-binding protein n=1 Tax=Phenylobacterium sp. TaxID=1871053 RepID=UPI001A5F29BD|nr:heme-binding protein [Phenylobacterium sp.]MBL8770934.1 heme-binding protein [Phenylobacterium sp.]